MRRTLSLLLIGGLVAGLAATSSAAPAARTRDRSVSLNDHLTGHLGYPALQRSDEFLARQEKLGTRPAKGGYEGDYGHKGCKAPAEYEVGDERTFWVSQNQVGNIEINAVLAAKSAHGYLWVQKEFYLPIPGEAPEGGFVTQGESETALVKWEGIYDIDRKYFGKEPAPGTPAQNLAPGLPTDWQDADCDKRISILNFPIDSPVNPSLGYIAGYYSSEHEYPNGDGEHQSPYSNEMEMFFMNSAGLNVGDDTYAGVLAHEFFHMIQFSNDYNEETWVNEGMADIAAIVNGFGDIVQGHIDSYSETPDQNLIDWTSTVDDYGQAVLFFDYLFNHYGAAENPDTEDLEAYLAMAKLLTRTSADGAKGITKVIKTRPASTTSKLDSYFRDGSFGKVFRDYIVANALDNSDASHGQYGYANRDVAVTSAGSDPQSPDDASAFTYSGEFYDLADQEGSLSATAQDPVDVIPASEGQPAPQNGFFAWSNRGDELLSWLERPANLGNATAPQLQFKYWYQIEEDWDYAYVRVSTDNGKTYDFLTTTDCGGRSTDPNGNNRAVVESGGITGDSGGWQECTLDLAAYAGEQVLIRFEYDTDQAVNEAGYVVDDVKLVDGEKQIWKKTNFEKNNRRTKAYEFGGSGILKWGRIKPLAKNKPLVQVVRVSGDQVIRKVLTRRAFEKSGDELALIKPATVGGERTLLFYTSTTKLKTTPFTYSYNLN